MPVHRADLAAELSTLLRLTAAQEATARLRSRRQARDPEVADELARNADGARKRARLIEGALSELGMPRDFVSPLLGYATAFVKSQVEQTATFGTGLLGDLALSHQLRERTRYARELATTLDLPSVATALRRLDRAHGETIRWLERRLNEAATGQTPALRSTPIQLAVGAVRRAALLPFTRSAEVATRLTDLASGLRRGGRTVLARVGRDELAEKAPVTSNGHAPDAKPVVEGAETRSAEAPSAEVFDLREPDLPISQYNRLSGDSIIRYFRQLDDPEDLLAVLAYEQGHRARKGVVEAAERRLADLGFEHLPV